jgi:hypothetical protein
LPISDKIQKRIDGIITQFGLPAKLMPTEKVEQAYENLRHSLIIYSSLKKHLEKKLKEKEKIEKYREKEKLEKIGDSQSKTTIKIQLNSTTNQQNGGKIVC